MSNKDPHRRIEIDGETLITDQEFCHVGLDDATRRTAGRLDHEGLPFVMIAGRKFRPLRRCLAWLANRIDSKTREDRPRRRRRGGRE
jgi:hypothetical protein